MFLRWAFTDGMGPYGSWGNGFAMRVSPVAYAVVEIEAAMLLAERSAIVPTIIRKLSAGLRRSP
jgi:hypothetical protein